METPILDVPNIQNLERKIDQFQARRSAVHSAPPWLRLGLDEELHCSQLSGEGGSVQRSLTTGGGAFL